MFRRRRGQDDFDAEIEAHIRLESERLKEQGLSEEEARMAARRAFGDVTLTREWFYESGRWLIWDRLVRDLRFGLRQLRKNPGFTAVAVITLALGIGMNTAIFSVVYAVLLRPYPYKDPERLVIVWEQNPSRGWTTNSIPLKAGRPFSEGDTEKSQRVVIVNEELARRYWPGQDPIGRRLRTGTGDAFPWLTVAGVAANVRTTGPDNNFEPELYIPCSQPPWLLSPRLLVIRTTIDPLAAVSSIRREISALDRDQPVSDIRTLDQIAGEPAKQRQFLMVLLGAFAGLALVLASVGIYGVLAYYVAHRNHEIGIRMTLGAARSDVLTLVLAQGSRFVLNGVMAGLMGAMLLTRFLESLLFEVTPTDPPTFTVATALLALVAFFACYIPAVRATKVDPMVALRYE